MPKIIKGGIPILIVLVSIGIFVLKYFADENALSITGPGFMKVTPDKQLAINIGQKIFFIDVEGKVSNSIDFHKHEKVIHGDFDFFRNGDLLIYLGHEDMTFLESLSRYARNKEKNLSKPREGEGLFRCDNRGGNCKLFSAELPEFYSAFRLFIDRKSDEVYIADTPRFKIYRFNREGEKIAEISEGYLFPNAVIAKGDELVVANTNKNEITIASIEGTFGSKKASYNAEYDKNNKWPFQMTFVDDSLWVLVAANNMLNSKVLVFDKDWKGMIGPSLDEGADPMGIAYFNDEILISDWRYFKIYRFDVSGKRLDDFSNDTLNGLYKKMEQERERYETLSNYYLVAFFVLMVIGFILAKIISKKEAGRKSVG